MNQPVISEARSALIGPYQLVATFTSTGYRIELTDGFTGQFTAGFSEDTAAELVNVLNRIHAERFNKEVNTND